MEHSAKLFPLGAASTLIGVALSAATDYHAFHGDASDSLTGILALASVLFLLLGMPVAITGAAYDRKRLVQQRTRRRGLSSWVGFLGSVLLLSWIGNVHDWSMALVFPLLTGLVTGFLYLVSDNER